MLNLTKSFLSCVSLSTILSLGACGDTEPQFRQTAQFSQANESEISVVLGTTELAQLALNDIPLIATLDAEDSESNCPQITATGIIGNGCVNPGGVRYDGSIEFVQNGVDGFPSVIYHDFLWTADAELSIYLDGSLVFEQESDGKMRYDLAMTYEVKQDIGAEFERAQAEMSAVCDVLGEGTARCAFEAGSGAQVDGLGEFTIEGTHGLGFTRLDDSDANTADVTLQGEESLHFEYVEACTTYTIEGGEPQNDCEE
jgi:uncharacterized lipoprotein YehR (DUF1307 family)